MRIDSANEDLSALLDGELCDSDASAITAKLQGDPELMQQMQNLKSLQRLLREEGPDMAPMGFHHRVMKRIEEEQPEVSWSLAAFFRQWHLERLGLGLAAVAVLFVIWPSKTTVSTEQWRTESAARAPIQELRKAAPIPEQSAANQSAKEEPALKKRATKESPAARPEEPNNLEEQKVVAAPLSEQLVQAAAAQPTALDEMKAESASKQEAEDSEPSRATMRNAGYQYTVNADDPKVKQALMRLASGFQGEITEGAGASSNSLLVEIPADKLTDFHAELGRLGVTMDSQADLTMFPGDTVTIKIKLQSAN